MSHISSVAAACFLQRVSIKPLLACGSTEGTRDVMANATGGVDPMYATNRVGPSFLYSFGPINRLMPNETYNVTLFFAELYWSRPGERLFNISTNNKTRLSNFDIFKAAGGRESAANITLPVKLGPFGQLVLQFDSVKDQASLAGISVAGPLAPTFKLQSFLQNDTQSIPDLYGPALVRLDTGALKRNYTDSTGTVWEADRSYQGGGIEVFNAVIANASDGSGKLYATNRANKTYTVVLHAADLYWGKPRQRIFSVTANGAPALKAYDVIAAAGGPLSAAQAVFNVTASPEGTILLQWTSIKDQAIVGAIEIYGPAAAPDLAAPAAAPVLAPAKTPVLAPAAAPEQAPAPQTLTLPLQPYSPATAPHAAPAYGSTFLQTYAPAVQPAEGPTPVPAPSAYFGPPKYAPTPAPAYAPSPVFAAPPTYSPPAYSSSPPAYGSYGGAF
ncbi:hypothetical protein COCSUDRAFT_40319 [Coccomyxa subellipsoidea C-169]|uniref:Malectin domain-containing protein n=1 Tax=Coccomyxa subellipsoidea (strain C-169) TaxID=574566 RepID=I0YM84_COCSC|nr:hypothetical protein COCSUDRAFT_58779 [Coccomyxa subellipsoidea C-169]XP_005650729.1 hypothetical protein COCSUDRAFT_40319 [Coccomyxa subellipsoidea C-169]EIE19503.1 hypothetical protein COCSUDRAFT_58779 [Coccomyxa subellipsoidea C-169]EIE26185.1 hypothetical protein COCSUDRAFT_40319 [Coccomyxa subellipsoidea C-169]|eukprot:XP_005644047.1 hypothetical protein COCSUDRAFT_58779 [Coccomyxa subellipsoidea C-169]